MLIFIAIVVFLLICGWISSAKRQAKERELANAVVQELNRLAKVAGPKIDPGLIVTKYDNWNQLKKRNPFL